MFRSERRSCAGLIRAALCVCILGRTLAAQSPAKVDFARDILPILRENCIGCHGPSQQMRGLRLDRRRDAMPNRVGANGARIVPGDSAKSVLYRRVEGAQAGAQMPPTGPLRPDQIGLIKDWIDQGADWPGALSGERDTTVADPAVLKMMHALRNGDRQNFHRLLGESANAVNAKGESGWTPLMYAALYGDAETVRLLLDKGAKPNAQNDDGGTALMYAIEDGEKTRLLLDRGADPNLRSGEGRTALLIAAGRPGSYSVVKLLLEKGADVKARPPDGRGVLVQAAGSYEVEVLRLLLDHGAETKPFPLSPALTGCSACFDLMLKFAEPGDLTRALQLAAAAGDVARINALLDRGAHADAPLLQFVAISSAPMPEATLSKL